MGEEKKLPKSLYDVVSELVTFIDDADYKRKEKNADDNKKYIDTIQKNNLKTPKDFSLNTDKYNNGLKN